ncbi:ubiquitin carboxyl-terminal hydrolase 4-like [Daktulosphaira vitifoliae]|uniref:ubiquitin carboxyl-terminal hydrolase 4-like n=1 Tax=Daktulosphaira vitifoliae TaxID=58002 RepID=UPI0021AA2FEB|nr:ubiquitin carboxyl-terminal hydrolase 4-like [Daktulosphaira vitifoliae]
METSEVSSILSSLHSNRFKFLRADNKESLSDSEFLAENLDKDLKTLPELSGITDTDAIIRSGGSGPSQMMTIDSSWNEDSGSCFPTSTNSSFPIPLQGPNDFDEFNVADNFVSRIPSPSLGLNLGFTADADLSEPPPEIGVCGLRNLGNTCFMSAGLQALLSTEFLVTYFLNFDIDGSEDTLIEQFADLVKRVWHGQFSVINPHQFKYVLGKRYAQFRDCSQHDCQEFLALLLDSLNEELMQHFSRHLKVSASRKTRKSSNPRRLLPRDAEESAVSSTDFNYPQTFETLTEEMTDNEQPIKKKYESNDASTTSIEHVENMIFGTDNQKTDEQRFDDLLNGKREICCDSSSDSNFMDLKRVKLDDTVSKSEIAEPDSIGSSLTEKLNNTSVINRIFQGQFESTVICSECDYISVMHEPFMYLSVPLPFATEQQIYITFVSATHKAPTKYLLTVNKQDDIKKLKSELVNLVGQNINPEILLVAEVFNKHISKILNDDHLVKSVDYNNRDLFAFELLEINHESVNGCKIESFYKNETITESLDLDSGTMEQGETCTICLESKPDMMHHNDVNNCTCILCEECIKMSCFHSSGEKNKMDCPVCRVRIDPTVDLISIEQISNNTNQVIRRLTIPIVMKQANEKDLIGRPTLVRLPSELSAELLYDEVAKLHPYSEEFSLSLVDGQGTMCSRCMWDVHCSGCAIPKTGVVKLRSSDTLAVNFENIVDISLLETEIHSVSTEQMRSNHPLTIYDCINAFSQSELLDENNPWWCPNCKKNQCATKTLSISKYPNCLIVYLKRFVFHENWGIKLQDSVIFPIDNLFLNPSQNIVYDLYACICHTGSTSMGHYTAYTKHSETNEWYYYNDENTTKTMPGQEDYCNGYILFYKKQGLQDYDIANSSAH